MSRRCPVRSNGAGYSPVPDMHSFKEGLSFSHRRDRESNGEAFGTKAAWDTSFGLWVLDWSLSHVSIWTTLKGGGGYNVMEE